MYTASTSAQSYCDGITVGELLEFLDRNEVDPDTVIRIANQPAWPLRLLLGGLVIQERASAPVGVTDAEDEDDDDNATDPATILWLVAGDHPRGEESPYASKALWDQL